MIGGGGDLEGLPPFFLTAGRNGGEKTADWRPPLLDAVLILRVRSVQPCFFPREKRNVIIPNATSTAATVNPAVEISARE
jgi:hypothetical protein